VGTALGRDARYDAPPASSKLAHRLEPVRDRDEIRGLPPVEQLEDRRADRSMDLLIEVGGGEGLGDLRDRIAIEEHAAEHALLRLEILGRDAV